MHLRVIVSFLQSFFAWHIEDADLYSVNFLHWGAPKIWYCVAPSSKGKFERLAAGMHPDAYRACKGFLRHKDILISPSILKQYNVGYSMVRSDSLLLHFAICLSVRQAQATLILSRSPGAWQAPQEHRVPARTRRGARNACSASRPRASTSCSMRRRTTAASTRASTPPRPSTSRRRTGSRRAADRLCGCHLVIEW
jgi:JmjC domain, hydroxylase